MKDKLIIPFADYSFTNGLIDEASELLNSRHKNSIDCFLWGSKYPGSAAFTMAYSQDTVLLKFFITEESILAQYTEPNEPVFKDSCVEFFIGFAGDNNYYNFEFNCKGTCLAAYGNGKENRKQIPASLIRTIKAMASFKTINVDDADMVNWELTLVIPYKAFCYHQPKTFKNKIARVNFYKCGDDLPNPHYLSWNPIVSDSPDFHLPQFFGNALFKEN